MGYHKTGSTFLQKCFENHPEINYINRAFIQPNLIDKSPYEFNIGAFEKQLERLYVKGKANVISEEELSGNIHTGGNGRSITFEMIERLSQIKSFRVELVVFIREPVAMIDSSYRQYIKKGGVDSFSDYVAPLSAGKYRHRLPGFSLEHFKYIDVIRHAHSKIKRVHVYIYEKEKKSLMKVFQELLGLDSSVVEPGAHKNEPQLENVSYNDQSLYLARITNRFCATDPLCTRSIVRNKTIFKILQKIFLWMSRKNKTKSYCFDKKYVDAYRAYYAESNEELSKLMGVELEKFGYFCNAVVK